jgi:glycosyltransferase involved in cell wall biosynthesis
VQRQTRGINEAAVRPDAERLRADARKPLRGEGRRFSDPPPRSPDRSAVGSRATHQPGNGCGGANDRAILLLSGWRFLNNKRCVYKLIQIAFDMHLADVVVLHPCAKMKKTEKLSIVQNLKEYSAQLNFEFNPWFEGFELVARNWDENTSFEDIETTVVVPTFNKDKIIQEQLTRILRALVTRSELIVVDDASTDQTLKQATIAIQDCPVPFTVIKAKTPIYETACNNVAFFLASGQYICDVQSDILIDDVGFDQKLSRALSQNNLCSVSGRCGHSWLDLLPFTKRVLSCFLGNASFNQFHSENRSVGKVGSKMFYPHAGDSKLYLSDTNNRGPWMTSRSVIDRLGYLDQNQFFLGNDDHDFNFRGSLVGLRCGYLDIQVKSNPGDGSTRQSRTGLNLEVYEWLKKNRPGDRLLIDKISYCAKSTKPIPVKN